MPLLDGSGRPLIGEHGGTHPDTFAQIAKDVLAAVRAEHKVSPRYDTDRSSDQEILETHLVVTETIPACYLTPTVGGRTKVVPVGTDDPTVAVGVEEFVEAKLHSEGLSTLFCESRPFQCLFGTLLGTWVCSPADERGRTVAFGGRDGVGADHNDLIWCILPEDFGTANHALRRKDELDGHIARLPDTTPGLLRAYDELLEPSRPLRQYLWAYTADDEARARECLRVLGVEATRRIVRFLAEDYWARYLGWPDLLVWKETDDGPTDPRFVEVKSSKDSLTDDQRQWIVGNSTVLRFPFRIAKVHRTETLDVAPSRPR